ncbi:spore coat assembly protein SafA [Bacillus halotolerans]|uniref:spore coat assembly protein SafA n=1 Tax=Bacillus halotolerans TaxID=260554 RepID=UPI0003A8845F|nr:spore coat assembly protein SafA [Bacillus halotolerans]UYO30852.1 spore coat assembly protein SafA [Bacillus halotolerans]
MKIHIVQKGDSLWKIAEKYGVDVEEVKKLNTQLSNPDLIMPGMKIKVPSGGVPVRKEIKAGKSPAAVGDEKQEHPFSKEKPKSVVDVEDTKPKEKQSVPFVPPMPNLHDNVYPEADVNDYYDMNQLFQPWSPPKPEEPKKHHDGNIDHMYDMQDQFPQQEAMSNMENANYPNMPNTPKAPDVGGMEEENIHHTVPNMPAVQPYYPYPAHFVPCPVPISPVLPGSGLCYPYFPAHAFPMHQPYGFQPSFVSPSQYDPGEYDNQHHENSHHGHYGYQPSHGAPQYASPAYGSPYGHMPYGPYYGAPQVMGAYQPNVAHGYMPPFKDHDDCGCDDDQQPYFSAPGYQGGAYGTPYMPYGGANPNPYAAGTSMPNQPSTNQMFGRPEEEGE